MRSVSVGHIPMRWSPSPESRGDMMTLFEGAPPAPPIKILATVFSLRSRLGRRRYLGRRVLIPRAKDCTAHFPHLRLGQFRKHGERKLFTGESFGVGKRTNRIAKIRVGRHQVNRIGIVDAGLNP